MPSSLELFHAAEKYIKDKYGAEVTALDKSTMPQGFIVVYAKKDGKTQGYNVKLSDLEDQPSPS